MYSVQAPSSGALQLSHTSCVPPRPGLQQTATVRSIELDYARWPVPCAEWYHTHIFWKLEAMTNLLSSQHCELIISYWRWNRIKTKRIQLRVMWSTNWLELHHKSKEYSTMKTSWVPKFPRLYCLESSAYIVFYWFDVACLPCAKLFEIEFTKHILLTETKRNAYRICFWLGFLARF